MKSVKNGFGKISKKVMTDPSISTGAKSLYALLCCYKNADNECNPSINRLADELGIGYSTCKRWIKELKEKEIITRSQTDQRSTSKTIVLK